MEPIFGYATITLFEEIFRIGIRFRVIAAIPGLHEHILGRSYGPENSIDLLSIVENLGADPIGENGEYHTLVEWSPLHRTGPLRLEPRMLVDARPYLAMTKVEPI